MSDDEYIAQDVLNNLTLNSLNDKAFNLFVLLLEKAKVKSQTQYIFTAEEIKKAIGEVSGRALVTVTKAATVNLGSLQHSLSSEEGIQVIGVFLETNFDAERMELAIKPNNIFRNVVADYTNSSEAELRELREIRSKYARSLYRIICRRTGTFVISVEELKEQMGISKTSKSNRFTRDFLGPALQELQSRNPSLTFRALKGTKEDGNWRTITAYEFTTQNKGVKK